jgi:peptidyl-tRNA hydrolase, PTH1 family
VRLIVGLGNPGREYGWTRHNMGFLLLDEISREQGVPLERRGLKSVYGRGRLAGSEVILAKPQTYMNLSGEAVQRLLHFFKIDPGALIVLHDDLDLPWGKIRIRTGGSSGGHRGILSIQAAIGTAGFLRIKLGIGRPPFPGRDPADYVLEAFSEEEKEELSRILKRGAEAVETILARGPQEAMNRFHRERGMKGEAGEG